MKIKNIKVGLGDPFFLIAGPCVIESRGIVLEIANQLKSITDDANVPLIFKASFDKANRTSGESFRGLGIEQGLKILEEVQNTFGCPVLTDVHSIDHIGEVASVVDVLQTPAFLCRQTDFIQKVASAGKPVNIKKGQFLAPSEMKFVVEKALNSSGENNIMVCERGSSFGYNNLVSDMRSLVIMRETQCPVVFDATHSVQLPGGSGKSSGGQREFVPPLARAAVSVGVSGIFMETHPNPSEALSDGPNSWPLNQMGELLKKLKALDVIVKGGSFEEDLID